MKIKLFVIHICIFISFILFSGCLSAEKSNAAIKATDEKEVQSIATDVAATFKQCSTSTSELDTFRYWLYTPANPKENMPLLVYLHGGSGKGEDLNNITDVDGFAKYLKEGRLGDVQAYVIIPQLPSYKKGWISVKNSIISLINEVQADFKIDKNNISLTGHSMGGTGSWNMALAFPETFARVAPLSGSARDKQENIDILKNSHIWAFVGTNDKIVPPESSENFVAKLKNAGGDADITLFLDADHFEVPALTYLDEEINLVGWLIGEDKKEGK